MTSRRSHGLTLVEVCVVIAILILTLSLLFPVFQQAKWRVKIARSQSQMRQIHSAIILYGTEYDGGGFGAIVLPPDGVVLKHVMQLPDDLFVTGGIPWKDPEHPPHYTWMPPRPDPRHASLEPLWKEHLDSTGGNPVILVDDTFNRVGGRFVLMEAYGIFYDGHIEKRTARGSMTEYRLWNEDGGQ